MVTWTDPAIEDLKSAFDYRALDSRFYAKRMVEIVIEKSESLNNFPKIGRVVPEQNNNNIRELFIYSYRLIYQIINPDVENNSFYSWRKGFNVRKSLKISQNKNLFF